MSAYKFGQLPRTVNFPSRPLGSNKLLKRKEGKSVNSSGEEKFLVEAAWIMVINLTWLEQILLWGCHFYAHVLKMANWVLPYGCKNTQSRDAVWITLTPIQFVSSPWRRLGLHSSSSAWYMLVSALQEKGFLTVIFTFSETWKIHQLFL